MKRVKSLLAVMLTVSVILSILVTSTAEETYPSEWQADILQLMDANGIPRTTTISKQLKIDVDVESEVRTLSARRVNSDQLIMSADVSFLSTVDLDADSWTEIQTWLESVVDEAIAGVEPDTEKMAEAIDKALTKARKQFSPNVDEEIPVWAADTLLIESVAVTMPFYPELTNGDSNDETRRLQERLVQLGFLDDVADGYFGPKTAAAVTMLEEHVRALEQDLIDAREQESADPEVSPEPTEISQSSLEEQSDVEETTGAEDRTEADPLAEPEPTPTPALTPVTPADGIADPLLQAYLFSDDYVIAREDLSKGDSGDAVLRMQRRLSRLGYMTDTPDGEYGGSTARSVLIFQYYNNLALDGVATIEVQNRIFSDDAIVPDNRMLSLGSAGDAVKVLQERLRVLGFMNGAADGDFGTTTEKGVKNLQEYLREREEIRLRADTEAMAELAESGRDIDTLLTVEVNGIADPLLLDDFYSEDFPVTPVDLENGAQGGDVVRLQRRLNGLEYYYSTLDGDYGGGTEKAVRDFQKRHSLKQTGIADQETMKLLFSGEALKALKPYVLKISTADQRVYAYGLDDNNEHTVLVRTMKCSTGKNATPTPKGTFQSGTGPGARWHYFKKFKCWAQYAYYVQGDIMIHSVLYNEKNGPVTQSSVNNLGRKASHGCIRLSVEDAGWIYKNCPANTKIIVY